MSDRPRPDFTVLHTDGVELTLLMGGRIVRGAVERRGGRVLVHQGGFVYEISAGPGRAERAATTAAAASEIFAPMTGTVVQVFAKDGDAVEPGAALLIVEAMKMEHRIVATGKAHVTRVHVKAGQQVDVGAPLVSLKPGASA